jgi:hypothetical protein
MLQWMLMMRTQGIGRSSDAMLLLLLLLLLLPSHTAVQRQMLSEAGAKLLQRAGVLLRWTAQMMTTEMMMVRTMTSSLLASNGQ